MGQAGDRVGRSRVKSSAIEAFARQRFGFSELRDGQRESIEAAVAGRDALVVMPTGSGKSAIYQIAGALRPGPTIVVSPLIALQQDQVEAIHDLAIGGADLINSTLSERERERVFAALQAGELEFLFLAPEQLANEETLARVRAARPTLMVVDEAHCVSDWGHDFRPDYLRLGAVIDSLDHPPVLALTATAAPPVRAEIVERLHLRNPESIVQGFDRPNLRLSVERFQHANEKHGAVLDWVIAAEKPGIVYAATRRGVDQLTEELNERGVRAVAYHAGLSDTAREHAQTVFMDDDADVIVATIAFGMGIDKPNVRFVAHHSVSDSIDAYYQEIGRAGRDGKPAEARLFYHEDDLNLPRFHAGGSFDEHLLRRLLARLRRREESWTVARLAEALNTPARVTTRVLTLLEECGELTLSAEGIVTILAKSLGATRVLAVCRDHQERRQRIERTRIEMMRRYAESSGCRREFILCYFGELAGSRCINCDCCAVLEGSDDVPVVYESPYPIGSVVEHATWGAGQVLLQENDTITVLFDSAGYRTLGLEIVQANGLLQIAAPIAS